MSILLFIFLHFLFLFVITFFAANSQHPLIDFLFDFLELFLIRVLS